MKKCIIHHSLNEKTNRTESVYLMLLEFCDHNLETQDQCERFRGLSPPKPYCIFKPRPPLEITTVPRVFKDTKAFGRRTLRKSLGRSEDLRAKVHRMHLGISEGE